jgi:hypothetical protein
MGCDTSYDTTRNPADILSPEVLENVVELVGIEPTDLIVANDESCRCHLIESTDSLRAFRHFQRP